MQSNENVTTINARGNENVTENKKEHNLCLVVALGVFRGQLEGIKEVQKIEFSDITPQWSETGDPYVLTIPLTTKNTFIALYRLVAGKYKLDTATTCKVNEVSVTITAPTKFTGYILVTGSVAYGSLEELLAIILNEEADHTYTLEEILGVPYKEPV